MLPIMPITPVVIVSNTRKVEVPVIQGCAYTKKIESNLWKCVTEEEYQQEQEQKRINQQKCEEMGIWKCYRWRFIVVGIIAFLFIVLFLYAILG